LPRSIAPCHPQHRAARPRRAGGGRFLSGGRRVSARSATRPANVDGSQLRAPEPTRPFPFPAIEKSTLANGMRVWTVHHAQVPLVSFSLLVRRGAASDPPGQDGLAAVTADMLDEGS